MQAIPLRAVMGDYEYDRERDRIRALYGDDADSAEEPAAKRDQMLADLFTRCGWTQEKLAEKEGKSQSWIDYRLRFGRFLSYTKITTIVVIEKQLTEWRFRAYWERAARNIAKGETRGETEEARFVEIVRLLQEPEPIKEPKPARERQERPSPQTDKARAFIRERMEAGLNYPRKFARTIDVSHVIYEQAMAMEEERARHLKTEPPAPEAAPEAVTVPLTEAAPAPPPEPPKPEPVPAAAATIDVSMLSLPQREKYEILEKRLRDKIEAEREFYKKELEAIFNDRVHSEVVRHIDEYLMPEYKTRLERADMLSKIGKPFTHQQFRRLLSALHPDNQNPEIRGEMFNLVKEKEVLLRPEEKDRPFSSNLPKSMAELLARKKAKEAADAKARKAARAKKAPRKD